MKLNKCQSKSGEKPQQNCNSSTWQVEIVDPRNKLTRQTRHITELCVQVRVCLNE